MKGSPTDLESTDAPLIDLARETPFTLGTLTVTPAALSIHDGTWSQRLEPRVMQVLVMLARASPEVVGRASLNQRVWGGRIVGEDAINRAVQHLRRLAAEAPLPVPFAIETIPRIGYRLQPGSFSETERTVIESAQPAAGVGSASIEKPKRKLLRTAGWLALAFFALVAMLLWRIGTRDWPGANWHVSGASAVDGLPANVRDVVPSPDGKRLAYRAQDGSGHERIFVRGIGVGELGYPVSPPIYDARHPAWSPDGKKLAFVAYDPTKPCRLYVAFFARASPVGSCETVREPKIAWNASGDSLLFGDTPGENAVHRISAIRIAYGQRTVLTSPPGDSLGDDLPMFKSGRLVFLRVFGWADEGWIERDLATDKERTVWRTHGVSGSVAALLPDGALAVAWTREGDSGLDIVGADGRTNSQPVALGPVTAISAASDKLLIEADQREAILRRPGEGSPLATVRGRIAGPALLSDGRLRFPVVSAGVARVWERNASGDSRPWGAFAAAGMVGLALAPDGQTTAAMVTRSTGREIVVFDADGRPIYRWAPQARSLNPAAWSSDGRRLIVPLLDGAGWRLIYLDPFGRAPPRAADLPGYAVVQNYGAALYAVRAGEATGVRELWRLDGGARRLPIDLTLFDIVNWRPTSAGVWLPDRSNKGYPRLVLRDATSGNVLRTLPAPGLAGPGSGLAADARGPIYVKSARDAPEYRLLTLAK